ncbi:MULTISPECIES: hypothetical protein [Mesorhizobium]|uniref:Transposase n=1 Tax=Mesorhizobium shonense TaxID=1209948 RepID=A0ABV2I3H3_9HYPH|nr:hypothetical protein [Mesorhizobium sp.]
MRLWRPTDAWGLADRRLALKERLVRLHQSGNPVSSEFKRRFCCSAK